MPTLGADRTLEQCLEGLERQTLRDFQVVVVDNGSGGMARRLEGGQVSVLPSSENLGYGGAINAGARNTVSRYVAALNDDAVASDGWLKSLVEALEGDPKAGMAASCVRQAGAAVLDSAGMLLCADGSSKQRGQGQPCSRYSQPEEVLLPSGSAAVYRRAMLDEIGWFDEDFFLYCEDTDLGLRARWAGWKCLYVPGAVVEHRYSHSAGRASAMKAYYVERNRLRVAVKNFPLRMLLLAPWITLARYFWHAVAAVSGQGAAGEFRKGNSALSLGLVAIRAHLNLAANWWPLWRSRRMIQAQARITAAEFEALSRRHSISARQVAAL